MSNQTEQINKLRISLSESISKARKKAGISRNKFAKDNNLTYSEVMSIESGKTNFGINRLFQISAYLNISITINGNKHSIKHNG